MTNRSLLAVSALVLGLTVVASTAIAETNSRGWFVCQAWNPSKAAPAVAHCITWSRVDAERMRATSCEPARMTFAAMRPRCRELSAISGGAASTSAG